MTTKTTLTPEEIVDLIRHFRVGRTDDDGRRFLDRDALLAAIENDEKPIPIAFASIGNRKDIL